MLFLFRRENQRAAERPHTPFCTNLLLDLDSSSLTLIFTEQAENCCQAPCELSRSGRAAAAAFCLTRTSVGHCRTARFSDQMPWWAVFFYGWDTVTRRHPRWLWNGICILGILPELDQQWNTGASKAQVREDRAGCSAALGADGLPEYELWLEIISHRWWKAHSATSHVTHSSINTFAVLSGLKAIAFWK